MSHVDGVTVVRALLTDDAAFVAMVPAEQVYGSDMPLGFLANSAALDSISTVSGGAMAREARRAIRERVQLTVAASRRSEVAAILRLSRDACCDRQPVLAPLAQIAVTDAGAGPIGVDPASELQVGSQDFWVSYNEPVG